jgi:hypothetical protein
VIIIFVASVPNPLLCRGKDLTSSRGHVQVLFETFGPIIPRRSPGCELQHPLEILVSNRSLVLHQPSW